jgi:hypothetical protein
MVHQGYLSWALIGQNKFTVQAYMYSCVHKSRVHLYKMCTVVQYICTGIYIKCNVCVYPVYMSCVHRRTVHQYKLCIVVHVSVRESIYIKSYVRENVLFT